MQIDFSAFILSLPIGILPLMLFIPLLGALIILLLGGKIARVVTLVTTIVEMALAVILALGIDPATQLTDPSGGVLGWTFRMGTIGVDPINDPGLQIVLGVDGISVTMIVLANLVVLVAAMSSNHITESKRSYYALFLLMQTGLLGVFMSIDLFGFFIFWELVLIPMFFIIGQWGEEGCQHAAVKFFIYTHLGSMVMLVGFFALYFLGGNTFNMVELRNLGLPVDVQIGFALAVFMGAGVKLPVWPLHNWLPYAHVKAPTPGSVILAGILLKMGGYAFIRLGLWMIPDGFVRLSIPFAVLAIFTCIYAAFTAMAQTDLKSLVAYTSINHMSWVLLGVAVGAAGLIAGATGSVVAAANIAIQGAVFMMFSHGTIISVMFILAGLLKYTAGSREIPQIKGLMERAPRISILLILASFAAFGLPGFSGFIAELLIIVGTVPVYLWGGIIAFGIFITVGYLLWTLNRIVFSDPDPESDVKEAPWSDLIAPILMMIPVLILGLWPDLILDLVAPVAQFILGILPGG